ncbi:GntR family transcriptional regulator [Streptosporangium sp. KLBMP 9127]|nr:GntR family transcriptional regulator [Streptosporangium sp. KLBMP 9127]
MPSTQQPEGRAARLPRRQILTDEVYETLKAMIMNSEITAGARVNIDALARDLRVSQTPLREALARLESDGLVTKAALKGYSVSQVLTRAEFEDLYELRRLLEPWAAARCAERAGRAGRARLQAEMSSCREPAPAGGYQSYRRMTEHDQRFHGLITELAGNRAVQASFERTHCHLHLFRISYADRLGTQTLLEHHRILDALLAGDPEQAAAAMLAHLDASRARLSAHLP